MTKKNDTTIEEKNIAADDIQAKVDENMKKNLETSDKSDSIDESNSEKPDEEKGIKDLTPEEKEALIKQFNEDPENTGYIVANDKEPDMELATKLQDQLTKLMDDYQTMTVPIAPINDDKNMTKYIIEFVQKHLIWEGSWWRTVITLCERLKEFNDKAKKDKTALNVDFVTAYVLNKIFNEDTIRSDYDGAVFMQDNLERLTYYGNRIALAYSYVTQYSKNVQTLQKAVMCLNSGLNVEVTVPELEPINITDADDKSKEMIKKFKEDGVL